MVKLRQSHPVAWAGPAPLWTWALPQQRMDEPMLLRFATDSFMDEIAAKLASREDLSPLVARPETWEQPPGTLETEPLKLYHPAHGRFYLIAASLICRIPGMPDRTIDPGAREKASFLLRRRPAPGVEQAWVEANGKGHWQTLAQPKSVHKQEERMPMFALNYQEGDRTRRVLAGFIPTASKETYDAAHAVTNPFEPDPEPPALRTTRYDATVQRGIDTLLTDPKAKPNTAEQQEMTTFILLDLASFLETYIPTVWTAVTNGAPGSLTGAQLTLYTKLGAILTGTTTWRAALKEVHAEWRTRDSFTYNLKNGGVILDLRAAVIAAYPTEQPPSLPQPDLPKIDPDTGDQYVIRCIYERPCCKDLHPAVVSDPSAPFAIASFFDPDAPARDIRIVMPRDTSIKGLRRMRKSVSIIVSEKLRSQMERIRGKSLSDVEDGNLNPASNLSLGMVCTLSIPIITICAMILLTIILQLLNIIFWWLPFVKICLPIKRR